MAYPFPQNLKPLRNVELRFKIVGTSRLMLTSYDGLFPKKRFRREGLWYFVICYLRAPSTLSPLLPMLSLEWRLCGELGRA